MARTTPASQLPEMARECIETIVVQLEALAERISAVERSIQEWHRQNEASQRLETIPGIGVITATAMAAFVTDIGVFQSARQFAAWLGLTPKLNGTGGKVQLGRISKAGDRNLRRLLVLGATSLVHRARIEPAKLPWIAALLARRPARVVTVAVANKLARIAWAVLSRAEVYRHNVVAAA
jgi:transposase